MGHARHILLAVSLAAVQVNAAQAAEVVECDALMADVDARIASGDYPEQNVQIARQMRASLEQMCAMLDASGRAQLAEGFENVLPTRSEAEQKALDRARADERRAQREARKTAEREAAERAAQAAPRLPATAGGRSIAGRYLDRAEPMYHVYLWDWDVHEGALRLVYGSRPSRQQFGGSDWSVNLYYAAVNPAGGIEHQRIRSRQVNDHQALALRRGHDEIVLESKPGHGEPVTLERWSATGGGQLGAIDLSTLEPDLAGARDLRFVLATGDGHLLYDATWQAPGSGRIVYGWCKVSVAGAVLGCASAASSDSVRPWAPFQHPPGGGLVVNVSPANGTALTSAEGLSFADRERTRLAVNREKRLLVLDDQGRLAWQAVMERDIFPVTAPQNSGDSMGERMAAMKAQQQMLVDLRTRYDANRNTVEGGVGLRRVPRIEPTQRGVAWLTKVTADRSVAHLRGTWLVQAGADGEINRLHLEPLADVLEAQIALFVPYANHYYVFARSQRDAAGRVVKIDAAGQVLDYGTVGAGSRVAIEAMEADADGVWLVGHGYEDGSPGRIWVERMVFGG